LWRNRFGPKYAARLKRNHREYGDTIFIDEVFIRIGGKRHYLWRAVDQESLPKRSECFESGTSHVIFEPLDFMARLAALVPKPGVNSGSSPGPALTRFHGVFAGYPQGIKAPDRPNSKHRVLVTPSQRSKNTHRRINGDERSPVERHAAMTCTRGHKGTTPETSIQYLSTWI
jgi:hypothetical protein